MNHAMLSPDGPDRVVVEVDWITGDVPLDTSLSALARWLRRETGKKIEVRKGHAVSREPAGPGGPPFETTVMRNASPEPGAYFVYVLYWDHYEKYRGITFPAGELGVDFPVVVMLVDGVEQSSWLWITRVKVERAVLVHEFGHVAGLVSSGRESGAPGRGSHCPDPRCRMYWGVDAASARYNLWPVLCEGKVPLEFCASCEAELAGGRAPGPAPRKN